MKTQQYINEETVGISWKSWILADSKQAVWEYMEKILQWK